MSECYRSSTAPALDTASDAGSVAPTLAADGYTAVGRYYSKSSWKCLTQSEAQELINAGLSIFIVYEDDNNSASAFSSIAGEQQALRALFQAAVKISQPNGTGIYFAVDYDASYYDYTHYIRPYFQAINQVFAEADHPYKIGIYGSGLICALAQEEGLVDLTWLSQSTGYSGYQQYNSSQDWNILQGPTTTISGVQFDQDTLNLAKGSYGGFNSLGFKFYG